MPARKDHFWLPWRIILVGQGNCLVGQGNSSRVELKQFRTCLTYVSSFSLFCLRLHQNANTMLSLQWPMKFGNIVQVGTSRYLAKITTLQRKADRFIRWRFSEPAYCSENHIVIVAKPYAWLQELCFWRPSSAVP